MKEILSLLLFVLILSYCISGFVEKDLNQLIYNYFQSNHQLDKDEYKIGNIIKKGNKYIFSIYVFQHPDDENGIYIGGIKKDTVTITKTPEKIPIIANAEIDMKYCFADVNSMYAWQKKWQEKLPKDQKKSFYKEAQVLFDLPMVEETNEFIGREVALKRAMEILLENPLFNEELLSHYERIVEILYIPTDIGKPVYHFLFGTLSPFRPEFEGKQGEKAYAKHEKFLDNYYKKFNKETLLYFSVLIDAKTGEAIEQPFINTEPATFGHYLDFFNRDIIKGESLK